MNGSRTRIDGNTVTPSDAATGFPEADTAGRFDAGRRLARPANAPYIWASADVARERSIAIWI
jgi:hypothetical protein